MKTKTLIITFLLISLNALNAQPNDTIQKTPFSTSINQADFNKGFIADPLQLISGKAAGVSITKKGSDPNVLSSIYIRGVLSNFSDGPLYIIDGVWEADPQFLIPDEIESIEILKDAASTAAYGSRGMAGVIIIKTKSIRGNKAISIDFNSYLSFNTTAKRMDLLSADELRSFVKKNELNFDDGGASTDWQDEIFRSTVSQTYNLSADGKIKNTGYRLSFNHRTNPGLVLGTDRKNTGLNLKLSQQALNDRLSIDATVNYRSGNSNDLNASYGTNNVFYQAYRRNPTDPVYEADGNTYAQLRRIFNYHNPLAIIDFTGNENTSSMVSYSINANYEIAKGLYFNINAGHSISSIENNSYQTLEAFSTGTNAFEITHKYDYEDFNISPNLNYSRTFNDKHQFIFRAAYVYRKLIHKESFWYKEAVNEHTSNSYTKPVFNSVIASVWYEYDERYFANALWNRESYSLSSSSLQEFSLNPIERTNQYPSLVAGWKIHNETFMNSFEKLSNLTLRAGFGYAGNNNFHLISYQPFDINIYNLETERMKELSIGIDIGLWNNSLTGSFVYYSRSTENALGQRTAPVPSYPIPYIYTNEFHFKNTGVELALNALIIQHKNFSWSSSLVYFRNRNELVSGIIEEDGIRSGFTGGPDPNGSNYTQLIRQGSPPQVFYLPILAEISEDGHQLYYTEDGELTRNILLAKREQMGQLIPRQELAWSNSFSFMQHFDLELTLRYVEGHSIFNATRMSLSNPGMLPHTNTTPEGVSNYAIGIDRNEVCDIYLEDASYLRLDNITFGYTITPKIAKRETNLRLYFSANNLFTITDYNGLDPSYDYKGIDYYNVYPLARSFVVGVKLGI